MTEILTILNHRDASYQECWCGDKINNKHICTADISKNRKIMFLECDINCNICIDWVDCQRKLKVYHNQWYVDRDGYTYCSECGSHATADQIPKTCGCEFYINKQAEECCNVCHSNKYDSNQDFCVRCECCYDVDTMICSSCDKEITYKEMAIISKNNCTHWFLESNTGSIFCTNCNIENDCDQRYEKCGNDTRY